MPKEVEECVQSILKEREISEERAWAICNAQFQAEQQAETLAGILQGLIRREVEEGSDDRDREDIVDDIVAESGGMDRSTINNIIEGDIECPPRERFSAFAEVLSIDESDLVAAAEEDGCGYDVEQESLPAECRKCGERDRESGSMYCEECAAEQQADPMTNGHDLDPATGEGICEGTGKKITAETMGDLAEDCPHCGQALSVIDQESGVDPSTTAVPENAAPVATSEWSVRELDGIASEMDVLSRATLGGGSVVWQSADGAIAYFAELPDKYREAIGEDAFTPSEAMHDNAQQALEWYEEHPKEFDAGADDGEGIRRARQIVRQYEDDEPLPPEYVVEIQAYLSRSEGQEGRAELDEDVPDDKPWLDAGYTAHLLWGGDVGLSWAEDLVEEMEEADQQEQQAAPGDPTTADAWQADGPAAAVSQAAVATASAGSGLGLGPGLESITEQGSNKIDLESLPEEYRAAVEADDFLIYGKASIEQYDRTDDPLKIEMDALEDALDRFFASEDAPGIISLYHDDIPVGVPVREHELKGDTTIRLESPDGEPEEYEFQAGDTLTTHIEDGDQDGRPELWLLSNIAADSEMAKEVRIRALEDQLDGYSVTIHRNEDHRTDEGLVVTECDLHAVTIGTSEIVKNAGSTFDVATYAALAA
jgi:hypothetical protein